MSQQSQFLEALGVTVNGVPLDNAVSPPPARAPNPPGTNNYLHADHEVLPHLAQYAQPRDVAEQQATYSGQAIMDDGGRRQTRYDEAREAEAWGRRSEGEEPKDSDDESTDVDALSEASYRRRLGPSIILLGMESDDPMDYGEWDSQSEWSMADSMHDYDNPEKILCESDQEFPVKGRLFLVKWKDCSILRSSWEWENVPYNQVDQPLGLFLQLGHPIRDEWEKIKEKQARGEEERFDVVKWRANCEEEDSLRSRRRVLRRWRRKLVEIEQVMQAEREDGEADFPLGMIERIEKDDREYFERKEREKVKEQAERKRKKDEEIEDVGGDGDDERE